MYFGETCINKYIQHITLLSAEKGNHLGDYNTLSIMLDVLTRPAESDNNLNFMPLQEI